MTKWDIKEGAGVGMTSTYDELKAVCGAKKMRLCSMNELCGADRKTPISALQKEFEVFTGRVTDNWFAVDDAQNQWGSYNPDSTRFCKLHTELANGTTPSWGGNKNQQAFYKSAKCCNL